MSAYSLVFVLLYTIAYIHSANSHENANGSWKGDNDNNGQNQSQSHEGIGKEEFNELKKNLDAFFLFTMAIMVFFMQAGFALLEAGAVRSKNTVNILSKNLLDFLLGYFVWFAVGWALAHGPGGNKFCGGSEFFAHNMDDKELSKKLYARMFNEYVWAANAATIVSGAIAERCNIGAYIVYTIVVTGWIYPCVCHWGWGNYDLTETTTGWLKEMEYHDFSGSGIVHLIGGVVALVACILIGPRTGRFTEDGRVVPIPGHSVPMSFLGGFILLFGFMAFNAGGNLTITKENDTEIIGRVLHITLAGCCSGGLSILAINRLLRKEKQWTFSMTLNGALVGVVAICAGCDKYNIGSAFIIGFFAALTYMGISKLMLICKLDDPLDAVAVHAGGGLLGVLMAPLFDRDDGIFVKGDTLDAWRRLGVNVMGASVIIAWTSFWSFLLFWGVKKLKWLRIEEYDEYYGMDLTQHGESAYPASAWVEDQYETGNKKQSGPPCT